MAASRPEAARTSNACQACRDKKVKCSGWPAEEDAHALLDIVVFNVGISQELFDARAFSDNLSHVYLGSKSGADIPKLFVVDMCLVFAIGRLLQARPDANGDIPGTAFFKQAMRQIPAIVDLRKHGILGVEVLALVALYLQIIDHKEEAYLYSSSALRVAISHGLHRTVPVSDRRRPEYVRRNRLWWSVYMQERRLCAAGGYPMSIADYAIDAPPLYDVAGYASVTAIVVNVRTARVTGQITSTIYSQKDDTEIEFVTNVQNILRSLHEIESTMPLEYSMELKSTGLLVAGRTFADAPGTIARTSSGLYTSVYSAVIYTVRPILLYMARQHREAGGQQGTFNPALRRLAEICVEAASKSILILQALQKRELLAKNAFLDLDATFSAGFIFVLVEAINPGNTLGHRGIDGARGILRYLVGLGNRVAATRLDELNRMCQHLELLLPPENTSPEQQRPPDRSDFEVLSRPFSFDIGFRSTVHGLLPRQDPYSDLAPSAANTMQSPAEMMGFDQNYFGLNGADLADIALEGNDYLYGVYHASDMPLTGVEQLDWEILGNINFES
ncbi:hypothetical protein BKA66DRAFT_517567 [Pyrenochaeta sp. MPI-SDFR-AT-0127]|nr:hypothetical protein BKA66DRAFT_517567 [Pyrenochaeta sp. MPI-SDFR-AT-0127]